MKTIKGSSWLIAKVFARSAPLSFAAANYRGQILGFRLLAKRRMK